MEKLPLSSQWPSRVLGPAYNHLHQEMGATREVITSAPPLCQPTLTMRCPQLLMLQSTVLVKGPFQGSLNHEG